MFSELILGTLIKIFKKNHNFQCKLQLHLQGTLLRVFILCTITCRSFYLQYSLTEGIF